MVNCNAWRIRLEMIQHSWSETPQQDPPLYMATSPSYPFKQISGFKKDVKICKHGSEVLLHDQREDGPSAAWYDGGR